MEHVRPMPGVVDLHAFLTLATYTGTLNYDDCNRLVGCILREVARIGARLQWLERAETISAAVESGRLPPIGIPLNTTSLRNGHDPVPPAWILMTTDAGRGDTEAQILTIVDGLITRFDRDGYLRMMEERKIKSLQAVRVLFDTLYYEVCATERHELFGEAERRLRNIADQLSSLLNPKGLTW